MWKKYFNFIKLKPGRVDTALFGLIDFSQDNIPVEKIKALYESDFPYLQITPEGKKELYGITEKIDQTHVVKTVRKTRTKNISDQ